MGEMAATAGTTEGHPTSILPLALTMGDPAGIGLDITLTAWAQRTSAPLPPFALLTSPDALAERAQALGLGCKIAIIRQLADVRGLPPDTLPILPISLSARVEPGRANSENAQGVIDSIERAVAETVAGRASGIVTNPISKATLYAAGFPHPGHTEFLGALAEQHYPGRPWSPIMMLASDALRVVPLTVHIPLTSVAGQVTRERIIEVCRITARDLSTRFGLARPRLALAGLNPHAGEGGSLGREEMDIIAPAIEELRVQGLDVTGPFPADTLFHAAARRRYDVAICMYHDQALIPIKTLAFDTGVNVTLGLPFIRTSPDHGTAFDIAGTGKASPTSLIAALRLAARMATQSAPSDV